MRFRIQSAGAITLVLLASMFAGPVAQAHDSPIGHIDRAVQIFVEAGKLHVIYRFRCEERQVMVQLEQMDTDGNGKISDEERAAYFQTVATSLEQQLNIEIDGKPLKLSVEGPVRLSPDLSQTFVLTSPVNNLPAGTHTGKFSDEFSRRNPGPYRWMPRQININGIEVEAVQAPGVETLGPHPAMIVVNLRIVVQPTKPPR